MDIVSIDLGKRNSYVVAEKESERRYKNHIIVFLESFTTLSVRKAVPL